MNYQEYLEKGQAILKRFHELTYEAYFVGGMVRDYVLKTDKNIINLSAVGRFKRLLLARNAFDG